MQPLPLGVALGEGQQQCQRERDDDEAAGHLELEGPGDGADGGEQHHGREEDPAELLRAHPEEALLVRSGDEHGKDPYDRQNGCDDQCDAGLREAGCSEPGDVAHRARSRPAQRVADDRAPNVGLAPCPARGSSFTAEAACKSRPPVRVRGVVAAGLFEHVQHGGTPCNTTAALGCYLAITVRHTLNRSCTETRKAIEAGHSGEGSRSRIKLGQALPPHVITDGNRLLEN